MDSGIFANNSMVIEMRSSQIKARFAGDDKPKVIFNSYDENKISILKGYNERFE